MLVSILSTENIWVPISPNDEAKYRKLEEARRTFMKHNSDHLSLVNVFEQWKQANYTDSWLNRNFLLLRAMKQARKIRNQLLEIDDKVKYDRIHHFFKSADGLIDDNLVEKKFRRAMTEGFYMNSARKITGNKEGTYLTADEQVIVKTDKWSCFDMFEHFPDWVLYTELTGSGTNNKGVMRLASEIKVKWIEK